MTINRTLSSFLSEQSANASFDGGTLFIDAVNGRVGIGNTAPGSALTVAGTFSSTGAATFSGGNLGVTIAGGSVSSTVFPLRISWADASGTNFAGLQIYNTGAADYRAFYGADNAGTARLGDNGGGGIKFYSGGVSGTNIGTWTTVGLAITGTLSATGAVTFTGAGTEQYRNTNSASYLRIANDSTGAAADSYAYIQNSATTLFIGLPSTGFTTSGLKVAGQAYVYHDGTGGLSIGATNGSGALRFYSGGTTERMRLDSSGNLGINTSSPGGYGSGATGPFFNVYHATGTPEMYMASGQTISGAILGTVGFASAGSGASEKRSAFIVSGLEASATSSVKGNLQFWTNNAGTFSEKVRLTASGEWLINTTTDSTTGAFPRAPLSIKGLSASAFAGIQLEASADQSVLGIGYDGSYFTLSTSYRTTGAYRGFRISVTNGNPTLTLTSGGDCHLSSVGSSSVFQVGSTTRGQLNGTSIGGLCYYSSADNSGTLLVGSVQSAPDQINFYTSSGFAGKIASSGTTTTYNTSSDYRMKEDVVDLVDSGSFIDSLRPVTGRWKADGNKFSGFIAHEFATVSPSSVSGEKDDVDSEGNPKYQTMQASSPEVIANIVAELQSLRVRVAELEATK